MKKPWSKPTINRLAITDNRTKEITMKSLIIISVVFSMFIAPAVIFYVNNGRIKMNNVNIKQGSGTLTVRPAGVAIKPQ